MTDDKLGEILPNKEDVFVTKVETHNDICVTCYCLNKNPLFFEVEKENMLYPTGKLVDNVIIKISLKQFSNCMNVFKADRCIMHR